MVKGAKTEWGACSRIISLGTIPLNLSYWNNVIAIGSTSGDIITLDAITGNRMAVLSGHTGMVRCVTFSSDGGSLASGAWDNTVKLWDMQTGGVARTFFGHTTPICSVSISADYTRIVSGSYEAICLWDIQTGDCLCTIEWQDTVYHVSFSPTDPQHIISISGDKVWEWDLNGQQIPPTYNGTHIAFSPDCTKFALCNGDVVTLQDSSSRAIEAQLHVGTDTRYCCFSPDGKLIAATGDSIAYVWDITSSDSQLIWTLVGHDSYITSLIFSSPCTLVSISSEESVRFWNVGDLPTDSVSTDPEPAPLVPSRMVSVGLQARTGIAFSSDVQGVVKIWDISTGLCKSSFQTPGGHSYWKDARLIDGRLIAVWEEDESMYIWDASKDGPPKMVAALSSSLKGLRISGDGSKIFCLFERSIQAWSIHTGEPVGEVGLELEQKFCFGPLQRDDSKIWIVLKDLSTQGWDFGVSNSPPVPLSDGPAERPLLDLVRGTSWQVKDTVTGKEVFHLAGRFADPRFMRWDGQYLVAGDWPEEVLILDFCHLYPQ